jgi:hypothetical protein
VKRAHALLLALLVLLTALAACGRAEQKTQQSAQAAQEAEEQALQSYLEQRYNAPLTASDYYARETIAGHINYAAAESDYWAKDHIYVPILSFCYNSPELKALLGADFRCIDEDSTLRELPKKEEPTQPRPNQSIFDIVKDVVDGVREAIDEIGTPKPSVNEAVYTGQCTLTFSGGNIPAGEMQVWQFSATWWSQTGWHIDQYYFDPVQTQYQRDCDIAEFQLYRQIAQANPYDPARPMKEDPSLTPAYAAAHASAGQKDEWDPEYYLMDAAYQSDELRQKYGADFRIVAYQSDVDITYYGGDLVGTLTGKSIDRMTQSVIFYIVAPNTPPWEGDAWRFRGMYNTTGGWRVEESLLDETWTARYRALMTNSWFMLYDLEAVPLSAPWSVPPTSVHKPAANTEGYTFFTTP